MKINKVEQAISSYSRINKYLKKRKVRLERRAAKIDPEKIPSYKAYHGWAD